MPKDGVLFPSTREDILAANGDEQVTSSSGQTCHLMTTKRYHGTRYLSSRKLIFDIPQPNGSGGWTQTY